MRRMSELSRAVALCAATAFLALSGCANPVSEPGAGRAAVQAPGDDVSTHDETMTEGRLSDAAHSTTSVRWSVIFRDFIGAKTTKPNPVAVFRAYAYLSLAQYRAVVAAEKPPRRAHVSRQGAVAAASAVVLSALFPADAAFFQSQLQLQENERAGSEQATSAFALGEDIGREVGAEIVELAATDRFNAVWTGTVPVGPGYWSSDLNPPQPPQLPLLGQMRPFFMESGDQFRPGPPPAFGSPEFLAALAEVRQFSDTRTAEQLRIAQFWAMTTGTLVSGFWNEETTKRIERYQWNERRAARALALVHMAAVDATISCYDAKYTYWLIRPYRADPAITTPIPHPNHPSYPSSHACGSSAAANVLAGLFPADAAQLVAMADEAGESRLYAGIHYRFDKNAGLRIGQQVAHLALRRGLRADHERPNGK
jgi:membrane-associated phospholipid phosphatase